MTGSVLAKKYRILKFIGAGSMGEVWAGQPINGESAVAIKVVQTDHATNPQVVARFKSEAMAASRLDHPNTVQLLDFGQDEGMLFIVMEFLRGQNLDVLLKRAGRLSEQRSLEIVRQVLDALVAAHQSNVIHRDLKPANIMLVKGTSGQETVKVLDFGIAKLVDPLGPEDPTGMMTLTRAGTVVGTPAYMSPEQAAGLRVDPRSDVYSVGVTLYHMITGEKPFRSKTLMGLLQQVINAEPPRVSSRISTVDARIESIIFTAMQKDPGHRFATARVMRDAVAQVIEAGDRTVHASATVAGSSTLVVPPRGLGQATVAADSYGSGSGPSYPGLNSFNVSQARPSPQVAAMQSIGGQTLPYDTGTFEKPPPVRSMNRTVLGGLALILALAFGGWVMHRVLQPGPSIAELERRLDVNAWGAAESYALEHFDALADDATIAPLVRRAMALRRQNYAQVWADLDVEHDPTAEILPGEWVGEARFPDRPERYRFSYVLERVDEAVVEGYCDWPGLGIRARITGYRDGNHLLLWDAGFILKARTSLPYNLYDKKSIFIMDDRLVGFDGPYRAILNGRRAGS